MHTILIEKLKEFKNKKVFFERLGGNNGDNLIEMGALEVFKNIPINLVENIHDSDVIIINGSGDLSYHPPTKPIEDTRQASIFISYDNKPVILLPSSFTAINADRLSHLLKKRVSQTILFARDEISFSFLKQFVPDSISIYSDHDMAFGLIDSDWIQKVKQKSAFNNLLIVERFDDEGATTPPMIYRTPVFLRSLIPEGLKRIIKKWTLSAVHKNTPFIVEASNKVKEYFPAVNYSDIKAADISLPQNYSFEYFIEEISNASVVVSTRLHVCIFSALIGKPVIAVQFEGGNKIYGVFEKSLKFFPNAEIWIKNS